MKGIGLKKRYTQRNVRIDSIKFIRLRKANEFTEANYFLTKDSTWFMIWSENPYNEWKEVYKRVERNGYTTDVLSGIIIMDFNKEDGFEELTGLRKQAKLKVRDIYAFDKIEMRVSDIRIV